MEKNKATLENWINTIQCIDCVKALKKILDSSVDLIIADPPYGISRDNDKVYLEIAKKRLKDIDSNLFEIT